MYKFGVHSFVWTDNFNEKDLYIITRAKELGFGVLDIAIVRPEKFPVKRLREKAEEVDMEIVTTPSLNTDNNLI